MIETRDEYIKRLLEYIQDIEEEMEEVHKNFLYDESVIGALSAYDTIKDKLQEDLNSND